MSEQEQVERLAKYIIIHVPGEPSRSEGAVDTAIRILQEQAERIKELELDNRRLRQLKEDMDCETGITDPMMAWRDEKTRADAAEQREQRLRAAIEQELQAIKDLVGETEFALRQHNLPYPGWCRHPEQCAGKTSCPEDPTCAD